MTYLTRTHLEQALTPEQVRTTAIIRIALMLGIMFFYAAIFLTYSTRTEGSFSQPDTPLMDILSLVHGIAALSAVMAAFYLSNLRLRKENIIGESDPAKAAQQAILLHRTSSLLLMAPIDGIAFFGGAICMIGVTNGTMESEPLYWLNSASGVVLILIGLATFPTREKILSTLEDVFVRG